MTQTENKSSSSIIIYLGRLSLKKKTKGKKWKNALSDIEWWLLQLFIVVQLLSFVEMTIHWTLFTFVIQKQKLSHSSYFFRSFKYSDCLWKVYCENQFSPPNISKEASVLCEHVFCKFALETRWSSVISQLSSADTIIQLYLMPQWITPHYSLIFHRNLNFFLDCVFSITLDNQSEEKSNFNSINNTLKKVA